MAQTSRRTSKARPAVRSARAPRGMQRRRSGAYAPATRLFVTQGTGTITVGTSRVTDLVASLESQTGNDLEGAKIKRIDLVWNGRPLATGASACVFAFFRGPSTLDQADLDPQTDAGENWISHNRMLSYGTRHLVATTPTLEFDQITRRVTSRAQHRLRAYGDTLWLCEAAAAQNWEAQWSASIWFAQA